ncbi:uncharacterized protein LOC134253720 [Saccostrea cucullata]|uniref:uncharacterized protein LOC134253720 n=1 Tax=Saccostrea cuccullata TaxID=36930 RepID=UPI002ED38666
MVEKKGWLPNKNSRICSEHFETGWHSDDRDDPNYRPTLFSYKCTPEENSERFSRAYRRNLTKTFEEAAVKQEHLERCRLEASVKMHSYSFPEELQTSPGKLYNVNVYPEEDDIDIGVVITADEGSQCDPDPLLQENTLLKEENILLKEKLHKLQWGVNKIKDDDVATRFYTGLPSFAVFLWLYK